MKESGSVHKVNHIMLCPNGKRFMVLYRWFNGQRKYTRLITCNVDGTDGSVYASHFCKLSLCKVLFFSFGDNCISHFLIRYFLHIHFSNVIINHIYNVKLKLSKTFIYYQNNKWMSIIMENKIKVQVLRRIECY